MKILVLADDEQRDEFLLKNTGKAVVEFVKDTSELSPGADAYFIIKEVDIDQLANLHQPVFINSVTATLKELSSAKNIHRFNGWNTFIKRDEWEIATGEEAAVKNIFEELGWKYVIIKDEPGMIAARVVAMIINEAYFALGDNISTKEEIDIAMKLGTNYPYGPFEWAEKIGLKNIYNLLQKLAENDERYTVSPAMQQELENIIMALILHIDTATEIATVAISNNNEVSGFVINTDQKDHAAFLQPAIRDLLKKDGISFSQLEAISVTAGPGSYTGLRVGLASAKGLCYALNIPLISLSTLEVMALSSIMYHNKNDDSILYCPMIDARRMEVFTAVYDQTLEEIIKPAAVILDENIFAELLKTKRMIFSGSGVAKLKTILENDHADYSDNRILPEALAELSYKNFRNSNFASISLAEPVYIKDFYTP